MESHELTSAVMKIENTLQEILSVLREIRPAEKFLREFVTFEPLQQDPSKRVYKMSAAYVKAMDEIDAAEITKAEAVSEVFAEVNSPEIVPPKQTKKQSNKEPK